MPRTPRRRAARARRARRDAPAPKVQPWWSVPPSSAKRTAMGRGHWLVKQEPGTYAWDDLVRDGRTCWDGVRNFQARNNLAAMAEGDAVLFYHSGDEKAVVGIARVARTAYPDPTTKEPGWVAVDLVPVDPLGKPVTLAAIKAVPALKDVPLIRQSRLSVMGLTKGAFDAIVKLGRS